MTTSHRGKIIQSVSNQMLNCGNPFHICKIFPIVGDNNNGQHSVITDGGSLTKSIQIPLPSGHFYNGEPLGDPNGMSEIPYVLTTPGAHLLAVGQSNGVGLPTSLDPTVYSSANFHPTYVSASDHWPSTPRYTITPDISPTSNLQQPQLESSSHPTAPPSYHSVLETPRLRNNLSLYATQTLSNETVETAEIVPKEELADYGCPATNIPSPTGSDEPEEKKVEANHQQLQNTMEIRVGS